MYTIIGDWRPNAKNPQGQLLEQQYPSPVVIRAEIPNEQKAKAMLKTLKESSLTCNYRIRNW